MIEYIDIKYALAKKGYSITRVARELGLYGPQSVSGVLKRKYISARVEERVSSILGVPLTELFPDRYKEAGHGEKGLNGNKHRGSVRPSDRGEVRRSRQSP